MPEMLNKYKLKRKKIIDDFGEFPEIANITRFSPSSAYQYLNGNKQSELFLRRLAEHADLTFAEFLKTYADLI